MARTQSAEETALQIIEAIKRYPEEHANARCVDCGVHPPYTPVQFYYNDGLERWVLLQATDNMDGWAHFSVYGQQGYRTGNVCPLCARKRGLV